MIVYEKYAMSVLVFYLGLPLVEHLLPFEVFLFRVILIFQNDNQHKKVENINHIRKYCYV